MENIFQSLRFASSLYTLITNKLVTLELEYKRGRSNFIESYNQLFANCIKYRRMSLNTIQAEGMFLLVLFLLLYLLKVEVFQTLWIGFNNIIFRLNIRFFFFNFRYLFLILQVFILCWKGFLHSTNPLNFYNRYAYIHRFIPMVTL